MKTSITNLPANKQAEIKRIKDALIPEYAENEMIVLFGTHSTATARGAEHPN